MSTLDFHVKLNGRTLSDLGVELASAVPHDFSGAVRESYAVPNRYGAARANVSVGQEKRLRFTVTLPADTDITGRQAFLDTLLRWLDGLIEIELGTATGRVLWGELEHAPIRARWDSVSMTSGPATLDLEFVIEKGVAVGRTLRSLGLSTTFTPVLNLGTAPSAPRVIMRGPASNPYLEYARHDGTVLARLGTTGSIESGEWWEFDAELGRVIEGTDATGARADVTDAVYSSGSWPILDRGDGAESLPPLLRASHPAIAYYVEFWL